MFDDAFIILFLLIFTPEVSFVKSSGTEVYITADISLIKNRPIFQHLTTCRLYLLEINNILSL